MENKTPEMTRSGDEDETQRYRPRHIRSSADGQKNNELEKGRTSEARATCISSRERRVADFPLGSADKSE